MTPEQKAATERLETAVREALDAQGLGVGVLTEFVVVAAQARFEDDGSSSTGVYYLTSGESVPYYRMLGLLDLTRIARGEYERFPPERIRSACTAAVYWTGSAFAPALVTGWCRYYGEWFVRLRVRRDVWRDREDWYAYSPGRLLPVDLDQRDAQVWLPPRQGN